MFPANVQGEKAAGDIIDGIKYFNNSGLGVETVIIGRGGGSQEDLFCFNNEKLAKTIYNSKLPIISAVGHEIDFTIADFTADLRAPTPSSAAELIVPDKKDVKAYLRNLHKSLNYEVKARLEQNNHYISKLNKRLYAKHPKLILNDFIQRLDELSHRLTQTVAKITDKRAIIDKFEYKLESETKKNLQNYYSNKKIKINELSMRFLNLMHRNLEVKRNKFNNLNDRLQELSPYEALKRGYSIVTQKNKIINNSKNINKDEKLEIKFHKGKCLCQVIEMD
mgnify:FL=1